MQYCSSYVPVLNSLTYIAIKLLSTALSVPLPVVVCVGSQVKCSISA